LKRANGYFRQFKLNNDFNGNSHFFLIDVATLEKDILLFTAKLSIRFNYGRKEKRFHSTVGVNFKRVWCMKNIDYTCLPTKLRQCSTTRKRTKWSPPIQHYDNHVANFRLV